MNQQTYYTRFRFSMKKSQWENSPHYTIEKTQQKKHIRPYKAMVIWEMILRLMVILMCYGDYIYGNKGILRKSIDYIAKLCINCPIMFL